MAAPNQDAPVASEERVSADAGHVADGQTCTEGFANPEFKIAMEILDNRWPDLDKRTMEVLAGQAIVVPISKANAAKELSVRLTRIVNAQFPHRQKRRKGRGELVLIRPQGTSGKGNRSAEFHPESTVSTDQALTRINLDSANSDTNRHILREHEFAVDSVDHIFYAVSPTHRKTLEAVLPVVEQEDSSRETAAKAGLYAPQVQRAYLAAQHASEVEFFREHERPAPVSKPYKPPGVSMEVYNRMPGQAVLPYFGDMRTGAGVDASPKRYVPLRTEPAPVSIDKSGARCVVSDTPLPTVNPYPPTDGCAHANRQWLAESYGYLELTCLDCRRVFRRKYALDV